METEIQRKTTISMKVPKKKISTKQGLFKKSSEYMKAELKNFKTMAKTD
jgi:hypothetical protein